ncbi:hypothetical protein CKO44_00325 [Rubrivivax gelatinosus]|uniref:Rhodanese domain-containing protein n=1 Tax=Rubrivivax gelatinosus TaxID=28068 RepID=A0ABS1DS00_RUBGE|nr:rhodanese-like domain-containing protein [Rubrivivax gelatinosus]MBK1611915.1 hypothetical protein [Rubrivivax gelatinosus]MBK1711572.1 hypothetical protein [Rubrivivax gelatinosus]
MTSNTNSSHQGPQHPPAPVSDIESIGGYFHTNRIEIQDFRYYALVVDLRPRIDFERDHLPGAFHYVPGDPDDSSGGARLAQEAAPRSYMPDPLGTLLARVRPGQRVLLYCTSGEPTARNLAAALRLQNLGVDVLPGGWDSYRQWVRAGLELLPRLVSWRVLASPLGCETSRVLDSMGAHETHQTLDLQRMAGWTAGSRQAAGTQPSQEAFETAIIDRLRDFSAERPVWTSFVPRQLGALELPPALGDAIAVSPLYRLDVPLPERLRHWRHSDAEDAGEPASGQDVADEMLAATLLGELAPDLEAQVSAVGISRRELPVLAFDSFEPAALSAAIRAWLGEEDDADDEDGEDRADEGEDEDGESSRPA